MTNGNEPINPADPSIHSFAGLTKREYFAAMAMQGIIAAHVIYETGIDHEVNARNAVKAADNLIKALNETQQ